MNERDMQDFYDQWHCKEERQIVYEVEAGRRKAEELIALLDKRGVDFKIDTVVDYGCGYGPVLNTLLEKGVAARGLGFDCSQSAIDYAAKHGNSGAKFFHLPDMDVQNSVRRIGEKIKEEFGVEKVDGVILFDLLEHIPDCAELVERFSGIANTFIIKLPLENSVFDNYVIPNKPYPGPAHANGHLREFSVNDVRYFIRSLGLAPLVEGHYVYELRDNCPPRFKAESLERLVKYHIIRLIKYVGSLVLPAKLYLRLIGGGGYICVAEFNRNFILTP
jgi:SAM-dependent methyltransferase